MKLFEADDTGWCFKMYRNYIYALRKPMCEYIRTFANYLTEFDGKEYRYNRDTLRHPK